jgi:hypothetical protein
MPSAPKLVARAAVVVVVALAWASLFWFVPPQRAFPFVDAAADAVHDAIRALTGLKRPWLWVAKGWLMAGVVVVVVAALHGGRRTGLSLPTSTGVRLLATALVVALPFQIALGLDPAVARYYRSFFGAHGGSWIAANGLVMLVEHMFIEGAVLSMALPAGLPAVDERPRRGFFGLPALGSLGLGRLVDETAPGPRTFLAVPVEAWPAIVGQGLVFGCIHFSKAPSELVTAFPGGIAVGWLTVRTGSVWPAATLHLVTGAVVVATLALNRG